MDICHETNMSLEIFLNDFQNWKQDVDTMIQENVELQECLKESENQFKQKQEVIYLKAKEIDYLHVSLKDLHKTIEYLQVVEDTNKKLELELETVTNQMKQTTELHTEEIKKMKDCLNEHGAQYEQQLQEQKNYFHSEMILKDKKYNLLLDKKQKQIADLQKQMSNMEISFKEEAFKIETQHRFQVVKLEEQMSKCLKRLTTNTQGTDREIYRNKLCKLQEEYQSQLTSYRQEIESLKKQLLCEKNGFHNEEQNAGLTASDNMKTVPKFNKKRKLYKPIDALLYTNDD